MEPDGKTGPAWGFRWRLLREPGLGRLLVAAGILGLLTVGDGFIYLVLQDRDSFAVQWFPLLYVGTNVVFLILAIPLGRLADRWGKARVFIAGHVALLACYLLAAAPVGGLGPTLACLVLLGAFYAATDGVLAALASQLTPPDKLATGLGAAQTVVALSRMTASVGFGVLWFALGPAVAMVVVGHLPGRRRRGVLVHPARRPAAEAGSLTAAGSRARWGILLVVTALVIAAAGAYAATAFGRFQESKAGGIDGTGGVRRRRADEGLGPVPQHGARPGLRDDRRRTAVRPRR